MIDGQQEKCKELEEELELSRLQIQQLQEELEGYFLENEELKGISQQKGTVTGEGFPAALSRPADFASASAVEIEGSYSESGYRDIHLKLVGLSLADGRYFDSLSCKLAQKAGMPALEFRFNGLGVANALSTWPEDMRDEHGPFLLFMPGATKEPGTQQQYLLTEITTEDRQLVFGVVNVLRDQFVSNSIATPEYISGKDIRDWRLAAAKLAERAERVNDFISVDELQLLEELTSHSYNHLWFECRNLQSSKHVYPSYSFKFAVVENKNAFDLSLEFRELDSKTPPLQMWPSENADEYGHKFHVGLNVGREKVVVSLTNPVTTTDRSMLSAIIKKLPGLIETLASSGQRSNKGWDFWRDQVSGLDQKTTVFGGDKVSLLHRAKARLIR